MATQPLCMLVDLPEYGSKELELNGEACFAVRQGQAVYLYKNDCPHMGLRLNLTPDQFLDYDQRYIQCTSHGALFNIEDGACVAGPCVGASLKSLPCEVIDGSVFFTGDILEKTC